MALVPKEEPDSIFTFSIAANFMQKIGNEEILRLELLQKELEADFQHRFSVIRTLFKSVYETIQKLEKHIYSLERCAQASLNDQIQIFIGQIKTGLRTPDMLRFTDAIQNHLHLTNIFNKQVFKGSLLENSNEITSDQNKSNFNEFPDPNIDELHEFIKTSTYFSELATVISEARQITNDHNDHLPSFGQIFGWFTQAILKSFTNWTEENLDFSSKPKTQSFFTSSSERLADWLSFPLSVQNHSNINERNRDSSQEREKQDEIQSSEDKQKQLPGITSSIDELQFKPLIVQKRQGQIISNSSTLEQQQISSPIRTSSEPHPHSEHIPIIIPIESSQKQKIDQQDEKLKQHESHESNSDANEVEKDNKEFEDDEEEDQEDDDEQQENDIGEDDINNEDDEDETQIDKNDKDDNIGDNDEEEGEYEQEEEEYQQNSDNAKIQEFKKDINNIELNNIQGKFPVQQQYPAPPQSQFIYQQISQPYQLSPQTSYLSQSAESQQNHATQMNGVYHIPEQANTFHSAQLQQMNQIRNQNEIQIRIQSEKERNGNEFERIVNVMNSDKDKQRDDRLMNDWDSRGGDQKIRQEQDFSGNFMSGNISLNRNVMQQYPWSRNNPPPQDMQFEGRIISQIMPQAQLAYISCNKFVDQILLDMQRVKNDMIPFLTQNSLCIFTVETNSSISPNSTFSVRELLSAKLPPRNILNKDMINSVDDNVGLRGIMQGSNLKQIPCPSFMNKGQCTNGNQCPYSHDLQQQSLGNIISYQTDGNNVIQSGRSIQQL